MATQVADIVLTDGLMWQSDTIDISDVIPVNLLTLSFGVVGESSVTLNTAALVGQVTNMPHRQPALVASLVPAFAPDMYNRIWFIAGDKANYDDYATFVDFGIILQPTTRYFRIWNAYLDRESVTCTAIAYTDVTQFEVHGPNQEVPPWTLLSNGLREYDALAYEDGSFEFRVTVTWTFADVFPADTLGVFVGIRATLFPWEPLDNTQREELEWHTEITDSNSGKEQRIRLRQEPRQSIQFTVFIPDEPSMSLLESLLYQWQKRAWGVPMWGEAVLYTDPIPAGTTELIFETAQSSFEENVIILFWQGKDKYSLSIIDEIDEFAPFTISLQVGVDKNFAGNTFLIPVKAGWMKSATEVTYTADGQAKAKANFALIYPEALSTTYSPDATLPKDPSSGAELLPVVHDPSLVRGHEKISTAGDVKVIDFNTGKWAIYSDSTYIDSTHGIHWRKETRDGVWRLRELLHYLKGKLNCMWLPTYREDMTLADPFYGGSADEFITVNEAFIYNMYGTNDNRRAVHFQKGPLTSDLLVTAVNQLPNETVVLSLSGPIGFDITSENTVISWLDKVRLNGDSVTMKWERLDMLECKARVLRVED